VLGDDSTLVCRHEGTIELPVQTEQGTYILSLKNALLAPQLRHTLISCSALSSSEISTYFTGPYCSLYDTSSPGAPLLAARCTEADGLYCLPSPVKSSAHVAAKAHDSRASAPKPSPKDYITANNPASDTSNIQIWHRRLGHTGADKVRDKIRRGVLPRLSSTRSPCQDCMAGKQHRHPFPGDFSDATEPGDVIHSDVVGPFSPSHSEFCYLVTFIDEFTRYVTIFAMNRKSDVLRCFQLFVREFERRHNATIKTIHPDNGGGVCAVGQICCRAGNGGAALRAVIGPSRTG
jgi:transposase InsO family protein